MAPSQSTLRTILFGSILLSVLGGYFFFFHYRPGVKKIKDVSSSKSEAENGKISFAEKVDDIEVEDVEEGEEGEEDEEDEESKTATTTETGNNSTVQEQEETKERYDTAVRLFKKLNDGGRYQQALEQVTEAINLAKKISIKDSELIILYNNRSATYEKLEQFEDAIRDINIILLLDSNHPKARNRRGRIYEKQGKLNEALKDYVYVLNLERIQSQQISNETLPKKIEEIAKLLAVRNANLILDEMTSANPPKKPLPAKSFCRSFFESYPIIHEYRNQTVKETNNHENSSVFEVKMQEIFKTLAEEKFAETFALVHELQETPNAVQDSKNHRLLSEFYALLGSEAHLLGQANAAFAYYEKGIALDEKNISVQLRWAMLALDLGRPAEATKKFEEIARLLELSTPAASQTTVDPYDSSTAATTTSTTATPTESPTTATPRNADDLLETRLNHAWLSLHRSSRGICRSETADYKLDDVYGAIEDLQDAINTTENLVGQNVQAKAINYSAKLKLIHVLTQIKAVMGYSVTDEEQEKIQLYSTQAFELFPNHEQTIILKANTLTENNEFQSAIDIVEEASKKGHLEVTSALAVKAATITTKMLSDLNNATSQEEANESQAQLPVIEEIFEKALILDPNSLEVLCQYAQTKSLFGKFAEASVLLKKALPLARNRDEAIDISNLLVVNETNILAAEEFRANFASSN